MLPCAAPRCLPPARPKGNPGPCPTRRNLHRASSCSVKQTYTLPLELRHHQFTSSHYERRLSACNLPLQGKLPYKSKYFISPITKQENLFQLTFKSPNLFSHYSLRQTGVGMQKSRFEVPVRMLAVLRPAQAPEGQQAHARQRAGGLQACGRHTVIALVLSRTSACVCPRARGFCNTGRSGQEFRFFNKETKAFSPLSRLSAEHQISKCSTYIRFQIHILIYSWLSTLKS